MGVVIDVLLEILEQVKGLREDLSFRNRPQWQLSGIAYPATLANRCHVCGRDLTSASGYVCNNVACPLSNGTVSSAISRTTAVGS